MASKDSGCSKASPSGRTRRDGCRFARSEGRTTTCFSDTHSGRNAMDGERSRPWIIAGGGLAAGKAATTLRKEGYDGELIVVSQELHEPYERPALSQDYMRGETPAAKLQAADSALWTSPGTKLVLGRKAVSLDVSGRRLGLDDGRWLE